MDLLDAAEMSASQAIEFVTDGEFFEVGRSAHNLIDFDVDYAITDRWSVAAAIPFVFAKYTDPNKLPDFVPWLPVDECRCWQRGWQDFGFTGRYNIVNGAFALTPSVSVGVPSHAYNFQGEAALGERLREFRVAVDAGQRLDFISSKLSIAGRYSYAFVEEVIDLPNDRSNAALEGAFSVTRQLATRVRCRGSGCMAGCAWDLRPATRFSRLAK